ARRGGPANFQGTGYQVDVAVVEALRLIIQELWEPHQGSVLSLEGRIVGDGRQAGFDLALTPGERHVEVKLAPTREEILDWLSTLDAAAARDPQATFALVHARRTAAA